MITYAVCRVENIRSAFTMTFLTTFYFYKIVLAIALSCLTSVYVYYKWAFYYWTRKGVPYAPASIPFGSATKLICGKISSGEQFKQIYEYYKSQRQRYVGYYMFAKPTLIVLDLKLIKAILTTDFEHFTDHGMYVNVEREPLTGHLFALTGQKWKQLRAKLTPAFSTTKIKMMFKTLVNCSDGLKEILEDFAAKEEPIDIKDVIARYTTDVIGSCAFGLDCNSLKDPNSRFRKFGRSIFRVSAFEEFVRSLAVVSPKIMNAFRLRLMNSKITNFVMDVVKTTVEYRESNNIIRNDFMHLLIEMKNGIQHSNDEHFEHSTNARLTINEIAAQVFVFFLAGYESSATTLMFCLYELVKNPHIKKRLKIEIETVLRKYDDNITYETLSDMPYMDKCIQETLRIYPPLGMLQRVCTEDYIIPDSNVRIEKGTLIFIPIMGIQHDPDYYPNPEKFDPERFNSENAANRDRFTWLSCGEGPRICIGMRLGFMQIKAALTVMLKDYDFSLSDKTRCPLVLSTKGIGIAVKGGIWLNVTKQ